MSLGSIVQRHKRQHEERGSRMLLRRVASARIIAFVALAAIIVGGMGIAVFATQPSGQAGSTTSTAAQTSCAGLTQPALLQCLIANSSPGVGCFDGWQQVNCTTGFKWISPPAGFNSTSSTD